MPGKAWSKAEVCVLRSYLLAGHTDEEIARLLTSKFPNSPRTVVAIRGKRHCLELGRRQHSPAKRPCARTSVKPRYTNNEGDMIVIIKDTYARARWWQIAAAFNSCVESHRQRSGDSVKRQYHIVCKTRMEFKQEILRKVSPLFSPLFSTLPASTAKSRSQSPDRLSELERQHSFIEERESSLEEHPVENSYDVTAVPQCPSASIAYSAEPHHWTITTPYYHQSTPHCYSYTNKALSMPDSQSSWMDEWVDCAGDVGSTGITWPLPDNQFCADDDTWG